MSKQGRGALIGAGIGLVAGFVVGKQAFDDQDGEPNGKLIALSSVLGGLLGMAIGASITH
ncbi:MAG: glycine zipper domain-containing protein [Gemmatimonadales bacterium]